jgi:hypothetical protein
MGPLLIYAESPVWLPHNAFYDILMVWRCLRRLFRSSLPGDGQLILPNIKQRYVYVDMIALTAVCDHDTFIAKSK